MLRLVVWLLFCALLTRAQDVDFSLASVSCNNGSAQGIRCDHDANDFDGHIEMTADSRLGNGVASTGYVFYQDRVRMLDASTGQAASFSTNFTFRITREVYNTSGDGIAFVMFANETFRGDAGGTLGVYVRKDLTYLPGTQGTKTFCVEFDTYLNPGLDPSNNHVGVDLENITSKVTAEAGTVGINLTEGFLTTSWIDYDFSRSNLEVRIANASDARPATPLISYSLDLSKIVDEMMSVGFAASTGGNVEYHELYNWSFAAFGLPPPISSPSPSPGLAEGIHDSAKSGKSKTGLIAGVSAGVICVLGICCCLGCYGWRVRRARRFELSLGSSFQHELAVVDMPFRFTYKQLSVATNGFSERSKLGEGGSSSVYRGVIASTGTSVAVKRVANQSTQGEQEFLAEIRVVSRLRHRNLVKLLGWCSDRGNYLLVYELMPNGSLDKLLFEDHGEASRVVLSWAQRLAIVRGVAAGLGYLHEGYVQQVIHRDIKSSNVMLDEEFNPKVGDFGLARLIDHSKNLALSQVAGTVGYIAPEAVLSWKSTDKTDVYAFGALALEVACARRPINTDAAPEQIILVDWVWDCNAMGNILRAADTRLAGDFPAEEMTHILLMGLLCSHPDPDARPSMREVELFLAGHVPLPPVPLTKPVPVFSSTQVLLKEMMAGNQPKSSSSGSLFTSSTDSSSTINPIFR